MKLKRENYLRLIRPYYDVDLIKVLTGVRRAGKSILLETIRNELIENGVRRDHIISLNLEDMDFEFIQNASELNREIKSRIHDDKKYYIFLDEIQHVEGFERALSSFRASLNTSLFVTGSNSTLLSGELATLLTGRTAEFEIFPFSFSEMKEYFELNGREFHDELIYDYIKWGGFPLRFDFADETSVRHYLSGLYESIISRDIIQGGSKIDKAVFKDIALYILANSGKEFSAENVAAFYRQNSEKNVSPRTIYNYLDKMKKAFLLHGVGRYNLGGRASLSNREKYYAVDTGFRIINTNTINYEDTFFLENIIFNELRMRGYSVFTGKTYKSEVDFIAIKDGKKCFIQVAYLLASQSTIEREFGAFSPISDASPKYVLSLDRIDMSHGGIAHINIVDFLLRRRELIVT